MFEGLHDGFDPHLCFICYKKCFLLDRLQLAQHLVDFVGVVVLVKANKPG